MDNSISNLKQTGDLKDKTLLLVNTGNIKKRFIIQKIKKLGVKLIVLNKEKNWATPYVDYWILADNANHEEAMVAVEKYIQENGRKSIDGVVTYWERDVLLTSKITDKFNFVGIPHESSVKARNKFLFREFCEQNNIPFPKYKLLEVDCDLETVVENLNFPLVIKPAFGAASTYVVKVDNMQELKDVYTSIYSLLQSSTNNLFTDGKQILVEEYIDGDEVDVDILLQNGKLKFFCVSDNYNKLKHPFFMDNGQSTPSSLPEEGQEKLIELAEEILEKLNVQNGCIHFEAKLTKKGVVPIEINLRMGGDYIYHYIKEAWGVDLIENSIKISMAKYVKINKPEISKKYLIGWDLHTDSSGVLSELYIDPKINKLKFVEEVNIHKKVGEEMFVPPDTPEYLGWITVSGDNLLDAQDNLKEALKYIEFKIIKFEDNVFLGKTTRENRFSTATLNKENIIKRIKIERFKKTKKGNLNNLHVGIIYNESKKNLNSVEKRAIQTVKEVEQLLINRGYKVSIFNINNFNNFITNFNNKVDIVFNFAYQFSDSTLTAAQMPVIMETLNIPYVGSDFSSSILMKDKILFKKMLAYHEIPTPQWDYINSPQEKITENLSFPMIIKPSKLDYGAGIDDKSIVRNEAELYEGIGVLYEKFKMPILIEEYIEGDEYNIPIIGNDLGDYEIFPLEKIRHNNLSEDNKKINSFKMRWLNPGGLKKQLPAKISNEKFESLIREISLDTYSVFSCHDFGLVEIMVDKDDNPYVIEMNSCPFLDKESIFVKSADVLKINQIELIEKLIYLAISRYSK